MPKELSISQRPTITVLMGVYNGAQFLPAQLHSIAKQRGVEWHLIASDDGSTDDSAAILRAFSNAHPGKVALRRGPGCGFSANYMSMIADLPDAPGLISFADQDDIWRPGKLLRGYAALTAPGDQPALYCGRHLLWTPASGEFQSSRQLHRPFTLKNALIENVASGNTILLNPAASRLARDAARRTGPVFAHDWWLYLLLSACGGIVHFDNGPPQILYRQHSANAIGAGQGILAQISRKGGVLRGDFARRLTGNLDALDAIDDWLTPEARQTLRLFRVARNAAPAKRLASLRKIGTFRQTRLGTLGFWGAASLGRV